MCIKWHIFLLRAGNLIASAFIGLSISWSCSQLVVYQRRTDRHQVKYLSWWRPWPQQTSRCLRVGRLEREEFPQEAWDAIPHPDLLITIFLSQSQCCVGKPGQCEFRRSLWSLAWRCKRQRHGFSSQGPWIKASAK